MYVRRIFNDNLEDVTNYQKQICFSSWKEAEDIYQQNVFVNQLQGDKKENLKVDYA